MLNSRTTLNITLVAAIILLAVIINYKPGVEPPDQTVPLTTLHPGQITQIEITRQNTPPITMVKEQQDWYIHAPINVAANTPRIENVLRMLQTTSHARFEASDKDLGAYSLDHPLAEVRFNDVEVAFGGNEPLNNRRYVRIGSTISLIADSFYYQVIADLSSFVALNPLPADSQLTRIVLPKLDIRKTDNGEWQVNAPGKDVSPDDVNTLQDAWRQAQAVRVSPYTGGDAVIGVVTIFMDQPPQKLDFQVLQAESELILGRADIGMRYHFSEEQAGRLMLQSTEQAVDEGDERGG